MFDIDEVSGHLLSGKYGFTRVKLGGKKSVTGFVWLARVWLFRTSDSNLV